MSMKEEAQGSSTPPKSFEISLDHTSRTFHVKPDPESLPPEAKSHEAADPRSREGRRANLGSRSGSMPCFGSRVYVCLHPHPFRSSISKIITLHTDLHAITIAWALLR